MKGFLIDENLPGRLTFAPSLPVVSSSSALHRSAGDSQLWEFARAGELGIVTKDADLSDRILASATPVGSSFAVREHAAEGLPHPPGAAVASY